MDPHPHPLWALLSGTAGDPHHPSCGPPARRLPSGSLTFCDPDVELLSEPFLKELLIFLKEPMSMPPASLDGWRHSPRVGPAGPGKGVQSLGPRGAAGSAQAEWVPVPATPAPVLPGRPFYNICNQA